MLSPALILGGCEAVALGVATPMVIQQKHVNLENASYAAVETMIHQAGKNLNRETPLIVSDLQEIVDTNQKPVITNPKIGPLLGGQMRDRFVQLGYNVMDTDMYQGGMNDGLFELSGTYQFLHSDMIVSLKMTDRRAGRIVTVYNYSLPVTYEIKKYMTGNANMLPPLF